MLHRQPNVHTYAHIHSQGCVHRMKNNTKHRNLLSPHTHTPLYRRRDKKLKKLFSSSVCWRPPLPRCSTTMQLCQVLQRLIKYVICQTVIWFVFDMDFYCQATIRKVILYCLEQTPGLCKSKPFVFREKDEKEKKHNGGLKELSVVSALHTRGIVRFKSKLIQ